MPKGKDNKLIGGVRFRISSIYIRSHELRLKIELNIRFGIVPFDYHEYEGVLYADWQHY